jgi:hypothetical protein
MSPLPTIAPGEWKVISVNTLSDVFFRQGGVDVTLLKGGNNQNNELAAWNSASYDTTSDLLVLPAVGGDADGADNGIYPFSVLGDQAWHRALDPTVNLIPNKNATPTPPSTASVYVDTAGQYGPVNGTFPCSRHTYYGLEFMPSVGRHLVFGGVTWPTPAAGFCDRYWEATAGLASGSWALAPDVLNQSGQDQQTGYASAWDSFNKRVVYRNLGRVLSYKPTLPAGSRRVAIETNIGNEVQEGGSQYNCACYDPLRHRFVIFGLSGGNVGSTGGLGASFYDMARFADGSVPRTQLVAAGGAAWPGGAMSCYYDPREDRYVLWNGGQTFTKVNPETGAITTETGTGANPGGTSGLAFNKLRYSPNLDLCIVVVNATSAVYAYRPLRASPVSVTIGKFNMLDIPTDPNVGFPSSGNYKHGNIKTNPLTGRVHFMAGDHSTGGIPSDYRQVQYSCDLQARIAAGTPNAGWAREHTDCPVDGTETIPKHPDHVGFSWDGRRGIFWMMPGLMVINNNAPANCTGETTAEADDPQFKWYHVMTFDPVTKRWTDRGNNVDATFVPPVAYNNTWHGDYDRVRNRILRVTEVGGSAFSCFYQLTSDAVINSGTWSRVDMGLNTAARQWRADKPQIAIDWVGRVAYFIDPSTGNGGRFGRINLDTGLTTDLGFIPFPLKIDEVSGQYYPIVFDTWNRVVHTIAPTSFQLWTYVPGNPGQTGAGAWNPTPLGTADTEPPGLGSLLAARVLGYDITNNLIIGIGREPGTTTKFWVSRYGGTFAPPASDVTSPTVTIDSPANGATVSGTITIQATATDNVGGAGMRGVQFKRDTTINIGAEDTTVPYSAVLDTTTLADGPHTLHAIATDLAPIPNTAQAVITVFVDNVPVPALTNLSPSSGPPGTLVTLTGTGFGAVQGTSFVTFGGIPAAVTSWTNTEITIVVPDLSPSNYSVFVTTSGGSSNSLPFTIPVPLSGGARSPILVTRLRAWA